jgi:hypothetical protein
MSLITSTRSELMARKGDWPEICQLTGLSYWWLIKFAQGRIEEPGVSKLEKLMEHFEANPRASKKTEPAEEPAT